MVVRYGRFRLRTYNRRCAMLLLNLRYGFDIIGTVNGARADHCAEKGVKVIFFAVFRCPATLAEYFLS